MSLTSARSIIGTKVMNKTTAEDIGEVKDVVFNPTTGRIEALILDEGGWFSDAKILPFSDVFFAGEDRVIIETNSAIKKGGEVTSRISSLVQENEYIKNSSVITEHGKKLGKVIDILFDRATGKVEQVEVSEGFFSSIMSGTKTVNLRDIESVGDTLIVRDVTEVKLDEQAKHQGISGAYHQGQKATGEALDAAKAATISAAQTTRDATASAVETTKEATASAVESTKHATANAVDTVKTEAPKMAGNAKQTLTPSQSQKDNARNTASDAAASAQSGLESAASATGSVLSDLAHKAQEAVSNINEKSVLEAKKSALGHYLTMDIISPETNEVIAKQGDKIDMVLLDKAEAHGMLRKVLGNHNG